MMWLWKLTGGRPMRCIEQRFMDQITWEPVYLWEDRLGRFWLATHSWSMFRVKPRRYRGNEEDGA